MPRSLIFSLVMTVAAGLAAPTASFAVGTDADACADGYERAQEQKRQGALVEARTRLAVCANPSCPAFIVKDCQRWLDDLDAALPTVVFAARKPDGRDLEHVTVHADGQLLADRMDGRALPVNPGRHVFRFEAPGAKSVEVEAIIAEGQKNRPIVAALGDPPGPAPAAVPMTRAVPVSPLAVTERSAPAAPSFWRPATAALVVTGALGVAGFAGFGYAGWRDERRLRDDCAPGCSPGLVDDISRKYLIADIGLACGAAALGLAGYLWLVEPARAPARVTLQLRPGGGSVGWSKIF